MENQISILEENSIRSKIHVIRGQQVMLDRDLAELYLVETKALNQAVKRNIERFPENFMFQLNDTEFENWRSQFVTSNSDKMGLRRPPYAFTEQGVAMLSAVLKSETAVKVSIQIMNAFSFRVRFLIIDNSTIYHIGASLKDLGKKCFGFSILDSSFIPMVLKNL